MGGLRFPKEPPPPNNFPGWAVIGVLVFFALMTVMCVIGESRGG